MRAYSSPHLELSQTNTLPSSAPLTKICSYVGCHSKVVTYLEWCDKSLITILGILKSQIPIKPDSSPPTAIKFWFTLLNVAQLSSLSEAWQLIIERYPQSLVSQTLNSPSLAAVTIKLETKGENLASLIVA